MGTTRSMLTPEATTDTERNAIAEVRRRRPPLEAKERRLLKVKEAAQYLSISPWSLRKLVQAQELPIVRLQERGPWLLDLRDLDRFIEGRKMFA
jgi:excisionase family DNA binding protein